MMKLVFPAPASIFINAISVIFLISLAILGLSEKSGIRNLQYSKFWNIANYQKSSASTQKMVLQSRTGMLIVYVPAFLAALTSLGVFLHGDVRVMLLSAALALHFFKRVLEVLFLHKYGSRMIVDSVILISFTYLATTASMIYVQQLTQGFPEPEIDLKYPGIVLFLIGICGNFYHHYLLSKLRKKGEREYKIPKGGLFGLVTCPHYMFEILVFVGFSFISQTLHALSITTGIVFYLMGRSCATKRWYSSKFEDFPKDIKAVIPYVL